MYLLIHAGIKSNHASKTGPGRHQAIIWTNDRTLLIGPLRTNFSEILIDIDIFLFKKCIWKCRQENDGHLVSASNVLTQLSYTETKMSSFWRNFNHWLHWKLSFWQLPVQPVMKISSKWRHFRFSGRHTDINGEMYVTYVCLFVFCSVDKRVVQIKKYSGLKFVNMLGGGVTNAALQIWGGFISISFDQN